jgi:hypothetical protein
VLFLLSLWQVKMTLSELRFLPASTVAVRAGLAVSGLATRVGAYYLKSKIGAVVVHFPLAMEDPLAVGESSGHDDDDDHDHDDDDVDDDDNHYHHHGGSMGACYLKSKMARWWCNFLWPWRIP